jgi:CRP-like cAMP-binding protein
MTDALGHDLDLAIADPGEPRDVTAALQLMKSRLAANRQAREEEIPGNPDDPVDPLTGIAPPRTRKTAKPPEVWNVKAGKSIFREGEMTYELFMLMEGAVDIYVGNNRVAHIDAKERAGTYLGEMGALLKTARTATVRATKPCKLLVFPDADRLFEEDAAFGMKLSTILAERLASSNRNMELVMDALHKARVKDEVMDAVKGAFQGKESDYVGKRGWGVFGG